LLRLVDLLDAGDEAPATEPLNDALTHPRQPPYEYHYVISREDNLSASRIRQAGPTYTLWRPRGKRTSLPLAVLRTLGVFWQSFHILRQVRPAAILSTGPAIAVPISLLGRLLGSRIIFVETGSRVAKLSLTGRIMYPIAHLFFVQWPQLQAEWPRARYEGRLL
jgi:UDP-N-acetylglucosamine:LPS N-acetylglucosamine transferase